MNPQGKLWEGSEFRLLMDDRESQSLEVTHSADTLTTDPLQGDSGEEYWKKKYEEEAKKTIVKDEQIEKLRSHALALREMLQISRNTVQGVKASLSSRIAQRKRLEVQITRLQLEISQLKKTSSTPELAEEEEVAQTEKSIEALREALKLSKENLFELRSRFVSRQEEVKRLTKEIRKLDPHEESGDSPIDNLDVPSDGKHDNEDTFVATNITTDFDTFLDEREELSRDREKINEEREQLEKLRLEIDAAQQLLAEKQKPHQDKTTKERAKKKETETINPKEGEKKKKTIRATSPAIQKEPQTKSQLLRLKSEERELLSQVSDLDDRLLLLESEHLQLKVKQTMLRSDYRKLQKRRGMTEEDLRLRFLALTLDPIQYKANDLSKSGARASSLRRSYSFQRR